MLYGMDVHAEKGLVLVADNFGLLYFAYLPQGVASWDYDVNCLSLHSWKEDTEGIQKSPTKIKTQEPKKASGGDSIPVERPLERTDSVDDEHDKSGKETKETAVDNKVKRTNKQKADDSPSAKSGCWRKSSIIRKIQS